jgi:drug/metabolite transporter (DMT)-like permease
MFKYSWEHGIPPMLSIHTHYRYITFIVNIHSIPFTVSAWRSHSMTIFLLPPALIEHFFTEPEKRVKWLHIYSPELSYPLLVHVFISAFSWAVALNAWAISLEYISTVLASICYSVQPLVMSIYFYFIGTYLSKFEIFGVFLSLCGIAISSLDGIKGELRSHDASEMIGVLLCICGGMSDVVMVLVRKQQKKFVPLFQVL